MFQQLEPWEEQLFRHTQPTTKIPVDDVTAYCLNPEQNWVYNKLHLCRSQGVEAYPHGIPPSSFPVFSKPIINLFGLGSGSKLLSSWDDRQDYMAGHFWMPVLRGEQYTTDFAVVEGKVVWHYTMMASLDIDGEPVLWSYSSLPWMRDIVGWVEKHLAGYTGCCNMETRDGVIFDAHLRLSPQFVDLYGSGWLSAIVRLYEEGEWDYTSNEPGYSMVLRTKIDLRPTLIEAPSFKGCSVQLPYYAGKSLSAGYDHKSYRLAIVNGRDLGQVTAAFTELRTLLLSSSYHGNGPL